MLRDFGSRDTDFLYLPRSLILSSEVVDGITTGLLHVAKVKPEDYQLVIMQGSGTYGMESVLGSVLPKKEHLLCIFANGAYGQRIGTISKTLGINYVVKDIPEDQVYTPEMVLEELKKHPKVTHVSIVHSETTSGLINPIEEIGAAIAKYNSKVRAPR